MRAFTLAYVLISAITIHAVNQERLGRFYDTVDNCADELHIKKEYSNVDILYCIAVNYNIVDKYIVFNKDSVIEFYTGFISNKSQRDLAVQIAIECMDQVAERSDSNYEKFIPIAKCIVPLLYLIDPIENTREKNEITFDERKRFYNAIIECTDENENGRKKYSTDTIYCAMKKLNMVDKYDRLIKEIILSYATNLVSGVPNQQLATSIVNRCVNEASQMSGINQEKVIYYIECSRPILDLTVPFQEIRNRNEDQPNKEIMENFYGSFVKCNEELNEKREFSTKVVRCMINKLHLLNDQGWFIIDKLRRIGKGVVRGKVKSDLLQKVITRCTDEAAQSSGTNEQKVRRVIECGKPFIYLLEPMESIKKENKLPDKETKVAFYNALTKCSDELHVKNIYSNQVLQCSFMKIGLTDSNGWIIKDKTATFASNLVYSTTRKDMVREISNRCHDAVALSPETGAEKTARFIQCAKSIIILLPPIEESGMNSSNF